MQPASQNSLQQPPSNLGRLGESYAVSYLSRHHFVILARNFRAGHGEIDIVANDHDTLVFVEVKTRSTLSFGSPQSAVTPMKLREIIKTAQYYMLTHPGKPMQVRIDVIAILVDADTGSVRSLEHIPNVS
ncbi:YraN family protein [Candidatus Gottesmanbacteria bacterium]|nr:YraN family protein [Candidatus Gottesmanbacteria bacterium]